MKKHVWVVLGLMLLVFGATSVWAGSQDFTLVNTTGETVDQLYISSSDTKDWESDVLGKDVLENGASTTVTFDGIDGDHCSWDLKIVTPDGTEIMWQGLNLCQINKITLKKGGMATLE